MIKTKKYLMLGLAFMFIAIFTLIPLKTYATNSKKANLFNTMILSPPQTVVPPLYLGNSVESIVANPLLGEVVITTDIQLDYIEIMDPDRLETLDIQSRYLSLPAGTYTFSFDFVLNSNGYINDSAFFDIDLVNYYGGQNTSFDVADIAINEPYSQGNTASLTFTLEDSSENLYLRIRAMAIESNSNALVLSFKNIMLNEGLVSADFLPYGVEPTDLIDPIEPEEPTDIDKIKDWLKTDSGLGLSIGTLVIGFFVLRLIFKR